MDFCLLLDVFPHFGQVVDVGLELFVGGVFGVGADDVAVACLFWQELVETLAQVVSFRIVLDTLGYADMFFLRKVDEKTPCQRDLCGKARPFGVDRVFDDLHQNRLPFKQHMFDALGFVGVAALFEDIDDVQKRRAFQTDVDERALHAGQYAAHHAQIDIADQAVSAVTLDVQFADIVFLQHRHACFLRRDVDQYRFGRTGDVLWDG